MQADLSQEDLCAIRNEVGTEEYDLHKCFFDIEALQFERDDPLRTKWLGPSKKNVWHDSRWSTPSLLTTTGWTRTSASPVTSQEETFTHDHDGRLTIEQGSPAKDLLQAFADRLVRAL